MQKVDLIVESLARSEKEEVEAVVTKLVATYPNLAENLLTNIGFTETTSGRNYSEVGLDSYSRCR